MEKFGVNAYSVIPRNPAFYKNLHCSSIPKPLHAEQSKVKMIFSAMVYYFFSNIFTFLYPHYRHHREFSALKEAFYGLRGVWRMIKFKLTERGYETLIANELSQKYYFVPLQTHNDFQIRQHSHYASIEKFIVEVLHSFKKSAPQDTYLVFKHHPVDRGRKNYRDFIDKKAKSLGIYERIFVFHDVYLPTCLKHAKGTITINSTVGLTSIGHDIPTLTLGNAIYDIKGLTNHRVSLDDFWHVLEKPDDEMYKNFHNYILNTTQLNGSFYGRFPKELEGLEAMQFCKTSETNQKIHKRVVQYA
jgi:capsular polysaccharide export protein